MDFSSIFITVIIFVTIHVGGNVISAVVCPQAFERHGDHCYKVSGIQASWAEAKAYCQAMGGDLARITNSNVQTYIAGLIFRNLDKVRNQRFWVDGSDMLESRVWRWMRTNGKYIPFSFTNWNPGEPNNIYEMCVEVRHEWDSRWNDEECHIRLSFICQAGLRIAMK